MEGIDIDSIVRKAVAEYRRQEREHSEIVEAHSLTVAVHDLQRRVETCEFEISKRYTDLLQRLERTRGER